MAAIALALACSIGWGFSDFLGGLRARSTTLTAVVLCIILGGVASAALATALSGAPWPGLDTLWPAIISGLASIAAFATLYRALAIGTMSIVAPIAATYPVVPVVVGVLRGERPSTMQAVGMALALAGVLLAAYDVGSHGGARFTRAAIVLAVLAALASGTMLTGLDAAAEGDPIWALLTARTVSITALCFYLATRRPTLGLGPGNAVVLILIGVLDTVATGLFAVASTLGYLSIVSVLASLFPVTTVILAHLILGERVRPYQGVGVASALAGVALIAAG